MTTLFPSCLMATNDSGIYAFMRLTMTGDISPDAGPLGRIHAAHTHIAEPRAFFAGCDTPLPAPALIRFLYTLAEQDDWNVVLP